MKMKADQSIKCYLCNSKAEQLFPKNGYQLFRCTGCGLIFYNFEDNYNSFLEKQYGRGYFTGEKSLRSYFDYGRDKVNITRNMRWYLEKIQRIKPRGKLLDVGCAYGYALEEAKKRGYDVYGIDPSSYAIEQARVVFGNRVSVTSLSDAHFDKNSFDVVTMFDVFEHLRSPLEDLKRIYNIMKKDGLLVIATGDTGSWWAKISGRKWTFYNPPQHIYYFNQETVTMALEKAGFTVTSIEQTGKWLSIAYILHLARTVGESRLADYLYQVVDKLHVGSVPIYLKLFDNMVVFAKKT